MAETFHTPAEPVADVEVTTNYVTHVAELSDAWAFIMDRVDRLGPDPTIAIVPFWACVVSEDEDGDEVHEQKRRFQITLSGSVPENSQ